VAGGVGAVVFEFSCWLVVVILGGWLVLTMYSSRRCSAACFGALIAATQRQGCFVALALLSVTNFHYEGLINYYGLLNTHSNAHMSKSSARSLCK
jgi:hypothetical protein